MLKKQNPWDIGVVGRVYLFMNLNVMKSMPHQPRALPHLTGTYTPKKNRTDLRLRLRSLPKCLDSLIKISNPFTEDNPWMRDEQYMVAHQLAEGIPSNWSISFACGKMICLVEVCTLPVLFLLLISPALMGSSLTALLPQCEVEKQQTSTKIW